MYTKPSLNLPTPAPGITDFLDIYNHHHHILTHAPGHFATLFLVSRRALTQILLAFARFIRRIELQSSSCVRLSRIGESCAANTGMPTGCIRRRKRGQRGLITPLMARWSHTAAGPHLPATTSGRLVRSFPRISSPLLLIRVVARLSV